MSCIWRLVRLRAKVRKFWELNYLNVVFNQIPDLTCFCLLKPSLKMSFYDYLCLGFFETNSKMKTHIRVGLTGGIGAGKSSVAKIFRLLGVPVYYADDRAKHLMNTEPELRKAIVELFGARAYGKDGRINRPYLAKEAFGNPEKLRALEAAVHPAVFRDTERWEEEHKDAPYTLREAALLFESGNYKNLDYIITVAAPEEVRIERVLKRDNVPRNAILARIRRQWPEEEKIERSDFVIINDGEHLLIPQVLDIHQKLLQAIAKS